MPSIAMQTRCIHCLQEQYAMAVLSVSKGKHPCVWCGKMSKKMSYKEYYALIAQKRKEKNKERS